MGNPSGTSKVIRFGDYTLDPGRASLSAAGKRLGLRPKAFDVLAYLIENRGRVVSKDELAESVWADVAVSDESLAKSISEVRLAMGADGPKIIKTIPRRGYIFDMPATELEGPVVLTSKPGPGKLLATRQLWAGAFRLIASGRNAAVVGSALFLAVLCGGLRLVGFGQPIPSSCR